MAEVVEPRGALARADTPMERTGAWCTPAAFFCPILAVWEAISGEGHEQLDKVVGMPGRSPYAGSWNAGIAGRWAMVQGPRSRRGPDPCGQSVLSGAWRAPHRSSF